MLRAASVIVLAALTAGCWQGAAPAPGSPTPQAQALSPAEQKAVDAAAQMLTARGIDYGRYESIKLTEDGKAYWIQYPTPGNEMEVLGPRSVTVDVATGKAELVMRD